MRPAGLEILELDTMGSDYVRARVALDGRLAVPFEFAKSDFLDMARRDDLEPFLARQARTLLDSYGDARENRSEPATDFTA
jgi:hypothetical protein